MNFSRSASWPLKALNFAVLLLLLVHCNSVADGFQGSRIAEIKKLQEISSNSIATLVELLKNEEIFIESIQFYLDNLQQRINEWNDDLDVMRSINSELMQDPEGSMANPLISFKAFRRQVDVWPGFIRNIVQPLNNSDLETIFEALASEADLNEAIKGLGRITDTYDLSPLEMAEGRIIDKQYDAKLSPVDCYVIGLELLDKQNSREAEKWLKAALLLENREIVKYDGIQYNRSEIFNHYTLALLKLGKHSHLTEAIQETLDKEGLTWPEYDEDIDSSTEPMFREGSLYYYNVQAFKELCRRGSVQPRKLHCRYNRTSSAYSILSPWKLEEISLDPPIVRYHDVINDKEIEYLKQSVMPLLSNIQILTDSSDQLGVVDTDSRSGKGASPSLDDPVMLRYTQRMTDITGLDVSDADRLDIVNYGLGGHYGPHFDALEDLGDADEWIEKGERIATFLAYLSDVEQGGSTVFPRLNIAVRPIKGSAILWYNVNNAIEPDQRLQHGSCPTVVGSKWIATEWIRSNDQMFLKPCYA